MRLDAALLPRYPHIRVNSTDSVSSNSSSDASRTVPRGLPSWLAWLSPVAFSRLITWAQFLLDGLTVFACYVGAHLLYTEGLQKTSPQTFLEFTVFAGIVSIIYIMILDRMGLYRREISLLNIKELRGIFRTAFYAAAFILALTFYWRSMTFSRVTLTVALTITPIVLYFQRQIFYRLHILFHQRGWSRTPIFIYGAGQIGVHLARRMFESPSLGYLPVGFLDDDTQKFDAPIKWSGIGPKEPLRTLGSAELIGRAREFGVQTVFIALPSATFGRNQELVDLCIKNSLDYAIVPNTYEKFVQNVELLEIGGIPIFHRRESHVSLTYLFMKRLFDFVSALLMLTVLSPLFLLFGAMIRMDTPGPIIFKQKRVGLRGREFSFYKFRTLRVDSEKYAVTPKSADDPRITRVGKWLRRTSLDELPQLFNVLRGDMSLVGPRPEMPFIVAEYTALEKRRLQAKPGITGVWQISAVRGEPIHANLEYDLFYLENRSILLDVAILVKTFISVIKGVGAI